MTLHKLKTGDVVLSPARQRLQDLLDQRGACARRADTLRAAQARLVDPGQEAAQAAVELVAFDRKNAEAMSAWAQNGITRDERPVVDAGERQRLIIWKQTSAENAAAAATAQMQLGAEIQKEDAAAKALQTGIEQAVAEIIGDTAKAKLADLRSAIAKQDLVKAAFETVVEIAHSGELETMKPVFTIVQDLSSALDRAAAPPAPDRAAAVMVWRSFAARLRTDAAAELEQ